KLSSHVNWSVCEPTGSFVHLGDSSDTRIRKNIGLIIAGGRKLRYYCSVGPSLEPVQGIWLKGVQLSRQQPDLMEHGIILLITLGRAGHPVLGLRSGNVQVHFTIAAAEGLLLA